MVRIYSWNVFCILRPINFKTFIFFHEKFVAPEYVLENDHVVLAFFDHEADEAVFCEGEPGQMLWKSSLDFALQISILNNGRKHQSQRPTRRLMYRCIVTRTQRALDGR